MTTRRRPAVLPQRVVGIGASAGGLEALRQLVARIPVDTGLAVVVLQHLPPSQTGQLATLLAKSTALPVIDAESGRRIESNTILIVPPHTCAVMYRGALVLRKAKPGKRPYLPIDQLFTSLAGVLDERAVGIVLSGTAHDGTEGLRAIQAAGGLTFAQDPATAQFDDMPRSAIAAGVAEVVLGPPEIGEELGVIAKLAPRPVASTKASSPGLDRILDQLREASGIDFTSYKRSTIERRLARRLAKLHLDSLDDYSAYLTEHANEARQVYEDLLIHVTEFFRDREVLDKLVAHLTTDIIRDRPADEPIRVWVPGCSTGEEVYSLAILLLERLGDRRIQLFGSDLSERAIESARIGRYPATIAKQVGATRLERFFNREDGGYRINKDVRERCVFVRHDLVTDPPFSKLDLVSCRNVLIYLGPPLQKRVIPIFHYALKQPGYLLLGRAEAITGFESLFSTLDAEARIYCRKPAARTTLTFPIAGQLGRQPWRRPTDLLRSTIDVQRDVDHVLLARYAPACVLVDENLDVVQFRGRTGAFLEAPPGQPQQNLLRMARDGLAGELPLALQRAQRTDSPVRRENVIVRDGNHDRPIHLEVVPVRGTADGKRHFLVVFEEAATKPEPSRRKGKGKARREPGELVRLRQELAATKEYLHSVVTQHLATSEDLGITNEELQSANEELQSSNEELQTAKEELVSTNEELETVNEELQHGNKLLREANDDLVNVLASVEIGIIIVDTERRVRRFTPKARSVMQLIPGDLGRPIDDLKPRLVVPDLDTTIASVIQTLEVHESEVTHPDGTWYRLQIRPYRTADGKTSGAVIAFVDITALRIAREYPAAIVETVPTPLVVIDDRLCVRSANAAFHALFPAAEDVVGCRLLDIGKWRSASLHARLIELITNAAGFDDFEIEHEDKGGERVLRLGARPLPSSEGGPLFLVAIADITELRRVERVRALAQRERDSFLDAVSHELRAPLNAIILWADALRELEHDDPRRQQGIETILESARSESRLVDDVLELALSRSTELAVNVESIDPASIIQSAVDAARSTADAKQIAIETTLEPGRHIEADPRRLEHIAANLISNAIKFTPDGGRVSVSLGIADGELELRVRDSGPGIAPEFLPHVFDSFSQADRSTTRQHPGLGIGLALVRHFVERQGGTIDVASSGNGGGTTFTVHLPVARKNVTKSA
ncbi:MAG TPA: chemotaxis protein CheB [Kofleriaceae bacterium]